MTKITIVPNDKVVISCNVISLENNMYVITPKEVLIGKFNEHDEFVSSDKEVKLKSIYKYDELDKTSEYYILDTSISELMKKYKDNTETNMLMYLYLQEMASKLIMMIKTDDKIEVFVNDYDVISEKIGGEYTKNLNGIIIKKNKSEKKELGNNSDLIDLESLERYVKERILENDDAVESICTTIVDNYTATAKQDIQSILSIGQTGTGKSDTYRVISEYLDIPLTIFDCNLLTAAGYDGKNIDDVLRQVYINSNRDIAVANKSILLFDEFDKIASKGLTVGDICAQQLLLKFLDGYTYNIQMSRTVGDMGIDIDTSFMTICFSGTFPDLFKGKNTIGFKITEESINQDVIIRNRLNELGIMNELIGRIPTIKRYRNLDRDTLRRVLLTSKNSPLLRRKDRYKRQYNRILEWTDDFMEAYIDEILKYNLGGRTMSNILAEKLKKCDHDLYIDQYHGRNKTCKKLILTHDIIEDPSKFEL